MKTMRAIRLLLSFRAFLVAGLFGLFGVPGVLAQTYQVGGIVDTNFGLQNRFQWTNDTGQIYTPSNTTIRLHDFDGKIVFYLFFDIW